MAGVSKTGGVTGAACPRCGAELKPLVGAGYQAQSCRSCKGIWVDNEGSRSIAAGAGELIDCATLPPGERPNDTRADGRCPICSDRLTPVKVAEGRIVLDICPLHGTWFDATEIAAVRAAARGINGAVATREGRARFAAALASIASRPVVPSSDRPGAFEEDGVIDNTCTVLEVVLDLFKLISWLSEHGD
jgi:Zn-finger nucleic acid-binding protein